MVHYGPWGSNPGGMLAAHLANAGDGTGGAQRRTGDDRKPNRGMWRCLWTRKRDLTESEALAMADFSGQRGSPAAGLWSGHTLGGTSPVAGAVPGIRAGIPSRMGGGRMLRLPMPMWSALNGLSPSLSGDNGLVGYASRTADFAPGLRACDARHTAGNHCPRTADHL